MHRSASLVLALLLCVIGATCSKSGQPTPGQPAPVSGMQRYHLTGRVVSIDKRAKSVMIDAEDIPGYMTAMTMPYPVKDPGMLDKLAPGDQVTADVVVQGDDSWLENAVVTGHSTPPKPSSEMHIPAAGEAVPDFAFVNQDNRSISLRRYRGQVLLITFIYTRCPFPDFCPRISHQFAAINRQLQSDPTLGRRTHLLSVSFDPVHDTPKILRSYGLSCSGNDNPTVFRHWEFAAPRAADLPAISTFFGLDYQQDGSEKDGTSITHSLSTAVIGPDGKIFRWYHGSDWQPSDLIKDAADALHAANPG